MYLKIIWVLLYVHFSKNHLDPWAGPGYDTVRVLQEWSLGFRLINSRISNLQPNNLHILTHIELFKPFKKKHYKFHKVFSLLIKLGSRYNSILSMKFDFKDTNLIRMKLCINQ